MRFCEFYQKILYQGLRGSCSKVNLLKENFLKFTVHFIQIWVSFSLNIYSVQFQLKNKVNNLPREGTVKYFIHRLSQNLSLRREIGGHLFCSKWDEDFGRSWGRNIIFQEEKIQKQSLWGNFGWGIIIISLMGWVK